MNLPSVLLFSLSVVGIALGLIQLAVLLSCRREKVRQPNALPPMSLLKPLCGLDDDLARNLERFANLDYPDYELLLGVRDERDAAYPLARSFERRYPERVRVVAQVGEAGLNPKVNQLVTLSQTARHDLLVVTDSNTFVERDYLQEIATAFEDPTVGLVTHPVAGLGEQSLGALCDNLHLSACIGPGSLSIHRVFGYDVVVGKSMAFRRRDLAALGGFESACDVLAEDFVLGRRMEEVDKRVVFAPSPVFNISRSRSVGGFFDRYARWGVMHRTAVGPTLYVAELLLQPSLFALAGFVASPGRLAFLTALVLISMRILLEGATGSLHRRQAFAARHLLLGPVKDAILVAAWCHGLLSDHVTWRGNRLRVLPGTRLVADLAVETELLEDAI